MIIDAQNLFEDGSVVLAGVTTTVLASQNTVDGQVARNLGVGKDIYLFVAVVAALVGASATLVVKLQTSPDNVTWTDKQTIGTLAALAAVGASLVAKLQPGLVDAEYIRLTYTVTGGTLTAGQLKASFTESIDAYTNYPNRSQITG
jgi:hypothetical protein